MTAEMTIPITSDVVTDSPPLSEDRWRGMGNTLSTHTEGEDLGVHPSPLGI